MDKVGGGVTAGYNTTTDTMNFFVEERLGKG